MQTPKGKAIELLNKINNAEITKTEWDNSSKYARDELKRKALIVVDEIINTINELLETRLNNDFDLLAKKVELLEVKQEIQKL